jgi:short-subunit dehydrogenase
MSDALHDSARDRPVALVTGASRGLGFLIARELADRGFDLVICARSSTGMTAAGEELRTRGGRVHEVTADVGDRGDAERLVSEVQRRFGRLDMLVTNAGVIQVGPAQDLTVEDYAESMDIMFWGTVYTTLAAMPMLRRSGGRLLAITSIGGKLPAPHLLPYTAAKHAAVGFAEGLRIEAARDGVSVTVAVPGLMRTGSTGNAMFAGDRNHERRWFTVAASLPVVSMDAERAARRLVRAAMHRRPEVILTPLAKVGARVHALAPSTTLRMLSVMNRLLPPPTGSTGPQPGHTTGPQPAWFARMTTADRRAAERWHERDDPA